MIKKPQWPQQDRTVSPFRSLAISVVSFFVTQKWRTEAQGNREVTVKTSQYLTFSFGLATSVASFVIA